MKKTIAAALALLFTLLCLLPACGKRPATEVTEDYTRGEVKTRGVSMRWLCFGKGVQPLVILPGLSATSVTAAPDAVLSAYAGLAENYKIWLIEPGDKVPAGYTIEKLADDTLDALNAIAVDNIRLFGVSEGGMIALILAGREGSPVDRLILASTAARETPTLSATLGRWAGLAQAGDAEGLYDAFGKAIYPEETYLASRDALLKAAAEVTEDELTRFTALAKCMLGFDATENVKKISCPVLVIGDEDDRVVGPEAAKELAELLKENPGAQLYMYKGYGHAVYDLAPDFKDRIDAFFAGK